MQYQTGRPICVKEDEFCQNTSNLLSNGQVLDCWLHAVFTVSLITLLVARHPGHLLEMYCFSCSYQDAVAYFLYSPRFITLEEVKKYKTIQDYKHLACGQVLDSESTRFPASSINCCGRQICLGEDRVCRCGDTESQRMLGLGLLCAGNISRIHIWWIACKTWKLKLAGIN